MYHPHIAVLLTFVVRNVPWCEEWQPVVDRTGVNASVVRARTKGADDDPWAAAADAFGRWRDGDTTGLDDLVAVMTPVLWHVVRAYRLPAEAAEDAIQATWLALVRRRDAIDDAQAIGAWLTTTARRTAARAAARQTRDVTLDPADLEPHGTPVGSAETAAVQNDESAQLWRAVATLDDRCQRLLRVLAFAQRPDYASLSAELEMPVGSIGPTRGRCLAKLRTALTDTMGSQR
jgi:RNA polymerase sigma factor (sigma-70 family)